MGFNSGFKGLDSFIMKHLDGIRGCDLYQKLCLKTLVYEKIPLRANWNWIKWTSISKIYQIYDKCYKNKFL